MPHRPWISALVCLSSLAAVAVVVEPPKPPETARHPVVDEYHGIRVTDDYRWLEKSDDPQVVRWSEAQTKFARSFLDRIPVRRAIKARLEAWAHTTSPSYSALVARGRTLFALKYAPPKNQPLLVTLPDAAKPAKEKVLLDPNRFDARGTTAIDFFVPSLDGTKVAVSLSQGGSEKGTLHIFEVATAKELGDILPRVNNPTAGGSVAWSADGRGLFYTRYPAPGERPEADLGFYQQIFFHRLGTKSDEDTYVLGRDFPRIAEIKLDTNRNGAWTLASVANGDGGEFAFYLRDAKGAWSKLTRFADEITSARFGENGDLFLLSKKGAPRGKILRLGLVKPTLAAAKEVVKESAGSITDFVATRSALYVAAIEGGPFTLRRFSPDGAKETAIAIPPISTVAELEPLPGEDGVLFLDQSYVQPLTWYRLKGSTATKTALAAKSPVDFSDIEVRRIEVTSKDGTHVPLTLLLRKGTRTNGVNPTILTAYGGYGISLSPRFRASQHLWLEHGGIIAIANLRGGGEYGEDWHRAGRLTHKQNVFDDFLASAELLVSKHYTDTAHLAIEGGSNGGLLMGAALTQRPDLFRAVVSHVGIYDMLRVELDPNGAFNVTEFGSVKVPEQFKALYGYSPYHHVKDGTAYPAILLLTGANDGRVNPFQSKKMAARLQASGTREPVLLRVSQAAGHGIGSSLAQQIEEGADVYAFLFDELKMGWSAAAPPNKTEAGK